MINNKKTALSSVELLQANVNALKRRYKAARALTDAAIKAALQVGLCVTKPETRRALTCKRQEDKAQKSLKHAQARLAAIDGTRDHAAWKEWQRLDGLREEAEVAPAPFANESSCGVIAAATEKAARAYITWIRAIEDIGMFAILDKNPYKITRKNKTK